MFLLVATAASFPPPASQSPCVSTNENHGIFRAQAIGCIYVLSCRAYPDIPRACLVHLVLKPPGRRGAPVARSPSNPAHSTMYNAVLGARVGGTADAAAEGSVWATAQVAVSPLPPQPHEVVLALDATRDHREAEIRMGLRALVTRGDMLRGGDSLVSPRAPTQGHFRRDYRHLEKLITCKVAEFQHDLSVQVTMLIRTLSQPSSRNTGEAVEAVKVVTVTLPFEPADSKTLDAELQHADQAIA